MKKTRKAAKIFIIILTVLIVLSVSAFLALYNFGFSGLRRNPVPSQGQIKIACVGDSITYGHGIINWSKNNYPVQLGEILGSSYCAANFGVNGSTVQQDANKPYTAQKIYNKSLHFNADVLVLMLGSNDSKAENWNGAEAFKEQYVSLVKSYKNQNENTKIVLCTPAQPFYMNGETDGAAKFGINPEVVSEICRVVAETAKENDCVCIDINALTKENKQWFSLDGVHPDKNGAKAIAEEIAKQIKGLR